MVRYEDWPKRLSLFLQSKQLATFKWGEDDCVMFVGQAVEALTGEDHYTQYKPYEDENGAFEVMRKNGGIHGLISKALGQPHRKWKLAKRGDVVTVKTPHLTAGIVDDSGQYIVCLAMGGGLTRIPLKRAWEVWSY